MVLVGFGSYRGSVVAGNSWGAPRKRMAVPPAKPGSWEAVFHRAGRENALLLAEDLPRDMAVCDHRAIGVVYRPANERFGNYVPTSLVGRYDAFLYLDETEVLHPLHSERYSELHADEAGVPETYPWGL